MRTRGFTLVELLITIAILGILAVVLIANLVDSRERAIDRAVEGYIRNVYVAALADVADRGLSPTEGDCLTGYESGNYSASPPDGALVSTCDVSVDSDGDELLVTGSSRSGTEFVYSQ